MAKSLIITEKPSVAQEFARILGVSGRNDGYIENDGYVITWCVGHLVEMVYPEEYDERYKKWRLEDLPFLPRDYKYNVIPSVSRQYDVVHKMLHREDIDTVYWAGDAGKEGQTIEENIRKFGGVREGMKELRVWIDSQTEEEILRGIREAKDMSEYDNLAKSGVMRAIEDYAMGINFSRAMSVKYGKLLNDAAGTSSYTAIAVGRVMTCVLGMVVIREREIRNFTETPFYRVVGTFHPEGEEECRITAEWKAIEGSKYFESPLLYKENGFKKEESAQTLIAELKGQEALIDSVETGTRKSVRRCFSILRSCRRSVPSVLRSVRMRRCRWRRICMRRSLPPIRERMHVCSPRRWKRDYKKYQQTEKFCAGGSLCGAHHEGRPLPEHCEHAVYG